MSHHYLTQLMGWSHSLRGYGLNTHQLVQECDCSYTTFAETLLLTTRPLQMLHSDHRIALESALHLINSIASIHAMLKTLQYIDGKPTPLIPKSTTVLPTGMLAQLCQANIGR
jgi:hypothetical protein